MSPASAAEQSPAAAAPIVPPSVPINTISTTSATSPVKNLVIRQLVKIKPNTTPTNSRPAAANNKGNKMMLKSYGVPLLPKPPSMMMVVGGGGQGMGGGAGNNAAASCLCNMKALVACQSCGAYCHDDCISATTRLCFTCLIR